MRIESLTFGSGPPLPGARAGRPSDEGVALPRGPGIEGPRDAIADAGEGTPHPHIALKAGKQAGSAISLGDHLMLDGLAQRVLKGR